ncbi:hypothetical protein HAX54_005359, partial [Datura stramonium]|nr:hypothetical protein [Datura stramonium]
SRSSTVVSRLFYFGAADGSRQSAVGSRQSAVGSWQFLFGSSSLPLFGCSRVPFVDRSSSTSRHRLPQPSSLVSRPALRQSPLSTGSLPFGNSTTVARRRSAHQ